MGIVLKRTSKALGAGTGGGIALGNMGTVLELSQNEAIVLSSSQGFMRIKRKPGMFIGQKIEFSKLDVIRPKNMMVKYSSIASSIAAVFIFAFLYFQFTYFNNDAYAYVDVDINPSIEFIVDSDNKVMEAKAINDDAESVLKNLPLKGVVLDEALVQVVKEAKNQGFIHSDNNLVLVAVSLDEEGIEEEEQKGLDSILEAIETKMAALDDTDITAKVVKVDVSDMEASRRNQVSMGKYYVYEQVREKGIEVALADVKEQSVTALMENLSVAFDEGVNIVLKEEEIDPTTPVPMTPTPTPEETPTMVPTPSVEPTATPTPTQKVTPRPTIKPTVKPTIKPTVKPTIKPTVKPTPTADPEPVPVGLIYATDPGVQYSGVWAKSASAKGMSSMQKGSAAEFTFTGTSVKWYGVMGNSQGKADVYIDGVFDGTVDCYLGEKPVKYVALYHKAMLSQGTHTIKIVVKGEKNPASTGTSVDINGFQYR